MLLRAVILALVSAAFGYLVADKAKMGTVCGSIVGGSVFGIGLFAVIRLAAAPRELWLTFGLKMVSVTAYKMLNVVLTAWCMRDLGLSSSAAQWVYVVWGVFILVTTLVAGSLTDALGLRKTLIIGLSLAAGFRIIMFATTNPWIALVCGMVPVAVGEALCTPVLVAATRRFTSTEQRSVAFSIFYAIMNVGFLVAYFFRDGVFTALPPNEEGKVALGLMTLTQERLIIITSAAVELLMLPFLILMGADRQASQASGPRSPMEAISRTAGDTWRQLTLLVKHPGFRRLIVFLAMIGLLKLVFNAMDSVLATFAEREIGPGGKERVGRFNSVNAVLILVLAPLVGILTRKLSAYSMVVAGGFVTALSFIFMALPAAWFIPMADGWLGDVVGRGYLQIAGAVHPYFIMIVLWQVAFSIGEALYSPRVYEYASSMAPPGQEASFASLSYVPLLIGKLATGALFSGILEAYCPATGPRDPGRLWAIAGLTVLAAPVMLLVLQRFIRVREGKPSPQDAVA